MEMYKLNDLVQNGESDTVEFKSARAKNNPCEKVKIKDICKFIGETLVAFGNNLGGTLLIGVEDNGEITGIPHDQHEITSIYRLYKDQFQKNSDLSTIQTKLIETYDGKTVMYFSIEPSKELLQLSDGRILFRNGNKSESTHYLTVVRKKPYLIIKDLIRKLDLHQISCTGLVGLAALSIYLLFRIIKYTILHLL